MVWRGATLMVEISVAVLRGVCLIIRISFFFAPLLDLEFCAVLGEVCMCVANSCREQIHLVCKRWVCEQG